MERSTWGTEGPCCACKDRVDASRDETKQPAAAKRAKLKCVELQIDAAATARRCEAAHWQHWGQMSQTTGGEQRATRPQVGGWSTTFEQAESGRERRCYNMMQYGGTIDDDNALHNALASPYAAPLGRASTPTARHSYPYPHPHPPPPRIGQIRAQGSLRTPEAILSSAALLSSASASASASILISSSSSSSSSSTSSASQLSLRTCNCSRQSAKLAQSRPPPVRTPSHSRPLSPPPLSPRASEKRHHSRRKSGKEYVATEKKAVRPAPSTRKTPQHVTKVNTSRREREHREDYESRGARDSGESFPQYCMTCEKQFLSADSTFLYCSEACRLHDQAPPPPSTTRQHSYSSAHHSPPVTPYSRTFPISTSAPIHEDGPDIIPRFSPTQSRPRSYFNSDPYPQQYAASPPSNRSSTALASLRELATALPKTAPREPESPPSHISRTGSGVWNYIPFTSSGSKTSTPTPSSSYTATVQAPYTVSSQSYGGYNYAGKSREDLYNYGKSHGYTGGMGMDRPLPQRGAPGGIGHRPRSIDLVTPFSTGGGY